MLEPPNPREVGPVLLLVDDENYFRRFVGEIVRRNFPYSVIEARDGDEALHRFHEHRPQIVLLDINMPHRNGLETLVALRALSPDVPIVMLTSVSEEMVVEECANLGASYFVRKDLPAPEILRELKTVLESFAPNPEQSPSP